MSTFVLHSALLTGRSLRTLSRQPMYLAFTLVQPLVWLLLFGALFSGVVALPGFATDSYFTYLTPGIVVMTAMFTAGWAGTSFITDMDRGVMARQLTSPVNRGALVTGSLAQQLVTTVVQSVIVLGVGIAAGARFGTGVSGMVVTMVCAVLVGMAFAALSDAIALLTRDQTALIAVSQFLTLPLTFLSSIMIAPALMPSWVAAIARYNPVEWAVVASREALSASPDWTVVWTRVGLLAALTLVLSFLATAAFRAYRAAS